ncbi:PREDICTED: uncharacterized protein LOC104787508 [Camelina sativa]|uniref:Uncharacterized protein LOC104787508 n=1 Tax=Camelina sativa TaxID=90675 RepID=A0ABM0Z791_CAMSA|nr:PREDICTED: uncharacterized protein LOC104787508 [Camelina sativa]
MLKLDKRLPKSKKMDAARRLQLALIVIVEGILLCDSSTVRASKKTVEMVKDVEAFAKYLWGRLSFGKTIKMVKVGDKVDCVDKLVDKLNQSHTATHGFTLAFQLLIFHAIPLLEKYLPEASDELTFTDPSVLQLTMLKTFHNSTIAQTEIDPTLQVQSILPSADRNFDIHDYSWSDEVDDVRVDYILGKLEDGHCFRKEDWQGGFAQLPMLTTTVVEKPKKLH